MILLSKFLNYSTKLGNIVLLSKSVARIRPQIRACVGVCSEFCLVEELKNILGEGFFYNEVVFYEI